MEILFFRRRVWVSVGSSHIFLKVLKLPINPYFCESNRIMLTARRNCVIYYQKYPSCLYID